MSEADRHATTQAPPFRVLIVCTANHCRSPMAEILMRAAVSQGGLHCEIASAGTRARDGIPMDPKAARTLTERRIMDERWVSQRLTPDLVVAADLILTAEESHRGDVIAMVPGALHRTYPMLQFARFARQITSDEIAVNFISTIPTIRSKLQPVVAGEDDIADPVGRPIRAFRTCAAQIERATEQLLPALPSC
jgi:protein-tyrosine phosphatase